MHDRAAPASPPTELPEAVETQVQDVRDQLLADAAGAGLDPQVVNTAVDDAVATYADAHVHAFIGVLVERRVRETLNLRSGRAT
jgi:hypothetical protein